VVDSAEVVKGAAAPPAPGAEAYTLRKRGLVQYVREAHRLREMGLEEGIHFSAKMPGGRDGYVYVRREGFAYAAWLSVHGSGERQRLATEFISYILQRVWEAGEKVYEKAKEIVEEGKARGTLTLKGFEGRVEVEGRIYVVKVTGWDAEIEENRRGRKLLRIRITAEVGRVENGKRIRIECHEEHLKGFGRYAELAGTIMKWLVETSRHRLDTDLDATA
jgi:hypothetical protein